MYINTTKMYKYFIHSLLNIFYQVTVIPTWSLKVCAYFCADRVQFCDE